MRASFRGWYPKSQEELKSLWDRAIIVPDTNILLHLLRHSPKVRGQLFRVFEKKKDALWIPYQVGIEFQRRRLDVQQQALDAYDKLSNEVNTYSNQFKNALNHYRAHPLIDVDAEVLSADEFAAAFKDRIAAARAEHPTEELEASFNKVTELFAGRVGSKPTTDRIQAIQRLGAERYAKKIPPGFEDEKKNADGADKYGDLIIWLEMIEKAKADDRPIVFVTDDGKTDWWYVHRGRKVGPHPALMEEFSAEAGQELHIYELLQFLRFAADSGSEIQEDSVQQIANTIVKEADIVDPPIDSESRPSGVALRAALRNCEAELDGLIKTIIELPAGAAGADSREALKGRVRQLSDEATALRDALRKFEGDERSCDTR